MTKLRVFAVVLTGLAAAACATPADEPEVTESATQDLVPAPPFYGDPANGAVFGVDVAMYQGPLAPAELDCFWESGVRHVIVGTQVEETARQQLAVAVARGMTVDAYVYLNWYDDMRAQVREAMKRVQGFPIGRMWLDVEDEDLHGYGYKTLSSIVRAGIDECKLHGGVECGIYTGPGFWRTFMNDTSALSDVPLWYARYNRKRALSDWREDKFGGWPKAVGKQWAEEPMCRVGVDKNTIQPRGVPSVIVNRSLPPDTGLPPPAPTGLYPADASVVRIDQVKLMVDRIARATRYQLALEKWNGREFQTYTTWSTPDGFQATYPNRDALYRFRARAENTHGWGPWSAPVTFDYGTYTGRRPGAPTPALPQPPPADGVPGSLSPSGTSTASTSVSLTCSEVPAASAYEFAIELANGASYAAYVTYATTVPTRMFFPTARPRGYRWRVRAKVGSTWGAWSGYATFTVS